MLLIKENKKYVELEFLEDLVELIVHGVGCNSERADLLGQIISWYEYEKGLLVGQAWVSYLCVCGEWVISFYHLVMRVESGWSLEYHLVMCTWVYQ